jgi:hypothetical protein
MFRKYVKNLNFIKHLTKIMSTLGDNICTFIVISRWNLLRMRNISDESCRENQNTHFVLNIFPLKIVSFVRWYRKIRWNGAGNRRQCNTLLALCTLHILCFRYKLITCNTYCFITATAVIWTRLYITLYIRCLYWTFMYLYTGRLYVHICIWICVFLIMCRYMCVYDMIWYDMIWYDIYIFFTAVGLTPGGSSKSHIYTQTVHIIQRYITHLHTNSTHNTEIGI